MSGTRSHTRRMNKPGGPRSIWVPRRVREVGAQFPDRQGRVSPSQAFSKPDFPNFATRTWLENIPGLDLNLAFSPQSLCKQRDCGPERAPAALLVINPRG